MKAASLGHQYLNVKIINENDIGRFHGDRKHHRKQQNYNQTIPTSDPLSRRSVAIDEYSQSIVPSVAILGRSYGESNDLYIVYEQQQQPTTNANIQHTDRGMYIDFFL